MKASVSESDTVTLNATKTASSRRLHHVWSQRQHWGADLRRHEVARESWNREYESGHWKASPVSESQLRRTSKSALHDARRLPFLRDILDLALGRTLPDDLIVFTNDDIVFAAGLTDTLLEIESAAWASRMEFIRMPTLPSCIDIIGGRKHCGADLFAMTPAWWKTNRRDYPDMVLGCEALDLVMRKLMLATGGVELHAAIAHEEHASWWISHRNDAAALHNRKLAAAWLGKRNLTWD